MGCSVLFLLFMCWTASVLDVPPLQCVVMYHTSWVLGLPTPLQNALWCWSCCYGEEPFELTLHTCNTLPFLYKITYFSSLDDPCCGCLYLCVWFAASHTKLNPLHHQFVTFFLTFSLRGLSTMNLPSWMNNYVIKYIFITIHFASVFLFLTLCLCFVKNLGTL